MTVSRASCLASLLLFVIVLRADCPEGSRAISEPEQQSYLALVAAIKAAIPTAPAGWVLQDRYAKVNLPPPTSTCKGLDPSPGYDATYFWEEQFKRNSARDRELDVRLKAASKFTPEEQKEMDDLDRPSRDLERKAQVEMRNQNPEEAARLRAEAKALHDKSNSIRKAHAEKIAAELEVIRKEFTVGDVNPNFTVHIVVNEENKQLAVKERLQINGATLAFFDGKDIVMSFGNVAPAKATGGIGIKPRTIWVPVNGSRSEAETIANLLANSSLSALAA